MYSATGSVTRWRKACPSRIQRRISEEATKVRRSEGRIIRELKTQKKEKTKSALRQDREKMIINMYRSGHAIEDIWRVSGYKSRTTIFRVLKRNGVELDRRPSPAMTKDADQD